MKLKLTSILLIAFAVIISVYNYIYNYDSSSARMTALNLSIPVNPDYIKTAEYAQVMDTLVVPFVDSLRISGTFTNSNHTISYDYYRLDSAKANVVISHGFTERKEKYKELAYYFLRMGYQVFILDHFGHGSSARIVSDSSMVFVDQYETFTNDLRQFITHTVAKHGKGLKTILFGHSMGGAIAARTVQMHPGIVDGLILNAPMMKIGNAPPDFIIDVSSGIMNLLGQEAEYALGHRGFDSTLDYLYDPPNPATLCDEKGEYWHNTTLSLTKRPSYGASWRAVSEFIRLTHDVVKAENVKRIDIPVLLFQAEKDTYVAPEGHFEFANNASDIRFLWVKGAGHEIYIENDTIVPAFLYEIQRYIEAILHTGT